MHASQTSSHSPHITPAKTATAEQSGSSRKNWGNKEKYLQKLEQCSSRNGMNIYEYLAIPTFIRQGKIIKTGY